MAVVILAVSFLLVLLFLFGLFFGSVKIPVRDIGRIFTGPDRAPGERALEELLALRSASGAPLGSILSTVTPDKALRR
jgi:hypothetical protein